MARLTETNLVKTQMTKKEVRLLAQASVLHFCDKMNLFRQRGGSLDDIRLKADVRVLYADALEIPSELKGVFATEYTTVNKRWMSIKEFSEALEKCQEYNHIMTKALKKFLRRNKRLLD